MSICHDKEVIKIIGLLCAGCLLNETSGGRDNIFAHENLNPLLGKEKEPIIVNGKSATLTTTFYNGIMLDYSYTFSSVEDGFEYAKHIRDIMGKSYGEPINYPDRILQNKFDDRFTA